MRYIDKFDLDLKDGNGYGTNFELNLINRYGDGWGDGFGNGCGEGEGRFNNKDYFKPLKYRI